MKEEDLKEVKDKNLIRRGKKKAPAKEKGPIQKYVALQRHNGFFREVEISVQDGQVIKSTYGKEDSIMISRAKAFGLMIDNFRAEKK